MAQNICKICSNSSMEVFAHTAKCNKCGVLLYYPYPADDNSLLEHGEGKSWPRVDVLSWYSKSSFYNHSNFTNMIKFVMDESDKGKKLDILDFGGGGGQFGLICKSIFPESNIYITDISDESLLEEWSSVNIQIPFKYFNKDNKKFDIIFLNDVFEHVSDPVFVLRQLSRKLKIGGRIFIDTPKQFWIFKITKLLSKILYTKVLRGTVSTSHLQIWSKRAFCFVIKESNLKICKYEETSEFTMPASYYLNNMDIKNPILKLVGLVFYRNAKWLAKNKIMCVLTSDIPYVHSNLPTD